MPAWARVAVRIDRPDKGALVGMAEGNVSVVGVSVVDLERKDMLHVVLVCFAKDAGMGDGHLVSLGVVFYAAVRSAFAVGAREGAIERCTGRGRGFCAGRNRWASPRE